MSEITGSNHLLNDFKCPHCGTPVSCGIGFRAGTVKNLNYKVGDKISWSGKSQWPEQRPFGGNFKTIGYFECENLRCETWNDCFPQVQEVLITILDDVIRDAKPVFYQPDKIEFAVFDPEQEI
ncbi:MAG: hypothetical protein K2X27_09855 [Candidatus Obscuribacterales bacterium]|nr:hypothetical protein [Candidatus Obscuribacterales bacterium]